MIYQPLSGGGLDFPNFRIMVQSLRLAWLGRLLSETNDTWKAIPSFYFYKYGGLAFLLNCNYNVSKINKNLPLFYRELLEYFNAVKKNTLQETNSKFILWNNQNITTDGNPVYWKSWIDGGILCVHDLLNSKGNFLSFNEFQRKFKINTNFLQYFQLLSAIPTDLKTQAREIQHPDFILDSLASPILKISEAVNVDLKTLRCKNYYKLISEKLTVVPTSFKTWEKQIPEISANWQQAFRRIYAFSKDNRLRQFSFKLLHRIITTKKELKRYNMANDDYCTRCLNPDSIEHTFINCHDSVLFYNRTLGWFNSIHNTEIDLSSNQTFCYMFSENCSVLSLSPLQKRRLDILLVYQNLYIYNCRVLEKRLNFNEFINKISLQWKLENCDIENT